MKWSENKQFLLLKYIVSDVYFGTQLTQITKNRNQTHVGLMKIAVSFGIEKCDVKKKINKFTKPFC